LGYGNIVKRGVKNIVMNVIDFENSKKTARTAGVYRYLSKESLFLQMFCFQKLFLVAA